MCGCRAADYSISRLLESDLHDAVCASCMRQKGKSAPLMRCDPLRQLHSSPSCPNTRTGSGLGRSVQSIHTVDRMTSSPTSNPHSYIDTFTHPLKTLIRAVLMHMRDNRFREVDVSDGRNILRCLKWSTNISLVNAHIPSRLG